MERISYQDIPTGMFEKLRKIEDFIKESNLDLNLIELVKLRVAQNNDCAYCVDMHHKELKNSGETDLRAASLCVWKATPYFSEKESAALTLADTLTQQANLSISDEIYNPLLQYFNKKEICFLTLVIAQANTWTMLMKTFKFTPGNYQVQKREEVSSS